MKSNLSDRIFNGFQNFEKIITVLIAVIIALIVVVSAIRIGKDFIDLFIVDIFEPKEISFEDYKSLFAKILTLLISLEFMNSILKVLKSHDVGAIVLDVLLIAAMAIGRKLIILDYDEHGADFILGLSALLISIGVFYYLVARKKHSTEVGFIKGPKE